MRSLLLSCAALLLLTAPLLADDSKAPDTTAGDALVARYFELETAKVANDCFADINTLADWNSRKDEYRRQLFEMLGLDPQPKRTPLEPVVTGTTEHEDYVVENVHFQSRPGLYVTGNLYRPKSVEKPVPGILYVCGHGRSKKGGISFGNKATYHHHGIWFARNGYVCLIVDTVQMGEIEGIHHGTHNLGQWWWLARGYTSAGAEAWNGIRALDYLETRPEVDKTRLGVTGRSGGGATSWWVAALDERIKAAVPVAGITSMHNHIVDGCVAGHCDCMFMVNTYQWDFPMLAALVAPRPLLLSNTDTDRIFPLDGVYDVFVKTRRIYDLYGASKDFGLQITQGGHLDTQELRAHAFVWFDRYLKQANNPHLDIRAPKSLEPEQLRVFETLPTDEKVTTIQEWFVPQAKIGEVASSAEWETLRKSWKEALLTSTFRAWPTEMPAPIPRLQGRATSDRLVLETWTFDSQEPYQLPLYVVRAKEAEGTPLRDVTFGVLDATTWAEFLSAISFGFPEEFGVAPGTGHEGRWQSMVGNVSGDPGFAFVCIPPRGIGPTEWSRDLKTRTHIRRRFALLGQTDDGMRVYDVRRGIQAVRQLPGFEKVSLTLLGGGDAAVWGLYASLFEEGVDRLLLQKPPVTHAEGANLLNILKTLDFPQALALALERIPVTLILKPEQRKAAEFAQQTGRKLNWKNSIEFE